MLRKPPLMGLISLLPWTMATTMMATMEVLLLMVIPMQMQEMWCHPLPLLPKQEGMGRKQERMEHQRR